MEEEPRDTGWIIDSAALKTKLLKAVDLRSIGTVLNEQLAIELERAMKDHLANLQIQAYPDEDKCDVEIDVISDLWTVKSDNLIFRKMTTLSELLDEMETRELIKEYPEIYQTLADDFEARAKHYRDELAKIENAY